MASSNQTPDVLFSPIAANADASDINTIPQTYDPANYGYAAQNVGFPTECRLPVLNPDGTLGQGRAPRMQDWNGIMKLVSSHNFFLQNGGSYTFNPTVSSNIGGYPKNAVLWYFPENEAPCLVYSLINDNTNNFVDDPTLIDGSHWEMLVNPSSYANIALTNSPYTTNRILEIPQNIQLELNNGTLTLKAGSKVYVPNGFEEDGTTPKFDTLTISNDVTLSIGTITSERFIIVDANGIHLDIGNPSVFASGSSNPGSGIYYWYDTTLNLLRRSASADGSFDSNTRSLTLGVISKNGDSINQIFNGFGYIGSTVFALPGVKVQYPNGRNEDGTCNSGIIVNSKVNLWSATGTAYVDVVLLQNGIFAYTKTNLFYDSEKNLVKHKNGSIIYGTTIASCWNKNTVVSDFLRYDVDSVANSNASNFSQAGRSYLSSLGYPSDKYIDLTVLASDSNYTAPANGWFNTRWSGSTTQHYIQWRNGTNTQLRDIQYYGGSYLGDTAVVSTYVKKGEVVKFRYAGNPSTECEYFRFYYAEGEN